LDEWIRRDAAVRQALFRGAHLEVSLRHILAQPDVNRPARPLVSMRRAGSWRRITRHVAIALAMAGGWIGTIFLAHQYRVLLHEHATAQQTIAALQARPAEAARPVEPPRLPEPVPPVKAPRPVAADRVVETRGLVLALPEGEGQAIPISAGGPVPLGRSLWTCPWGAAAMRLADGAAMQLDRNTIVALSEVQGKRQLAIKRGVFFLTRQNVDHGAGITVTTGQASVEVVDAQVAVAVDKRRTLVEVAEGQVHVAPRPDGPSVVVSAGHYLIVGADASPRVHAGRLAWRLEPAKPGDYVPVLPPP
jgi:ferric-dicitrate binding protein FerR (iron transport regulator)